MISLSCQNQKKTFSVPQRMPRTPIPSDYKNRCLHNQNQKYSRPNLSQKFPWQTANNNSRTKIWCSKTNKSRQKYRSAHRQRFRRSQTLQTKLHLRSHGENSRKRLQISQRTVCRLCTMRMTMTRHFKKSKLTTTRTWPKN